MKRQLIQRPLYTEFLTNWKNEDVIKVVSGGNAVKSTLLKCSEISLPPKESKQNKL